VHLADSMYSVFLHTHAEREPERGHSTGHAHRSNVLVIHKRKVSAASKQLAKQGAAVLEQVGSESFVLTCTLQEAAVASSACSCSCPTVSSRVLSCSTSHKPARVASQSEAQALDTTQPDTAAARAVLQCSTGQQYEHCSVI